jgi:hypothetical protein
MDPTANPTGAVYLPSLNQLIVVYSAQSRLYVLMLVHLTLPPEICSVCAVLCAP